MTDKPKIPHPYADQHGIRLWHRDDGWEVSGKTYGWRDQLREAGFTWNPTRKSWTCGNDLTKARTVASWGAWVMIRCIVASHCHEVGGLLTLNHKEVAAGYAYLGCGLCDTPSVCGPATRILGIEDTVASDVAGVVLPQNEG